MECITVCFLCGSHKKMKNLYDFIVDDIMIKNTVSYRDLVDILEGEDL